MATGAVSRRAVYPAIQLANDSRMAARLRSRRCWRGARKLVAEPPALTKLAICCIGPFSPPAGGVNGIPKSRRTRQATEPLRPRYSSLIASESGGVSASRGQGVVEGFAELLGIHMRVGRPVEDAARGLLVDRAPRSRRTPMAAHEPAEPEHGPIPVPRLAHRPAPPGVILPGPPSPPAPTCPESAAVPPDPSRSASGC